MDLFNLAIFGKGLKDKDGDFSKIKMFGTQLWGYIWAWKGRDIYHAQSSGFKDKDGD